MNPEILLSEAKEMQLLLTKHRRYLHTHPELGFDLRQTKEYVKKELISIGYEPVECGKCGLVVLAGSKNSDKTFLIRADMDALPILEQADIKFKSENTGKMHACGHDMHTAMLLGAARLLKTHESEIRGTVKLMFQPAEETLEGCKDMVDADVLNNPTVDAALMLHVTLGMPLQTGSTIICDGGISAPAADYFEIKIQGKGCHGAMPELGVDPITIASHIVIALQELHARELAMADDAVLTIGTMQAGDANNIIPDTAVLRGTMRAYDENIRKRLKVRLEEISKGIAKTFRGVADVKFTSGCPTLLNNTNVSVDVTKYCKELLGKDMAFSQSELRSLASSNANATKAVGSEDFAYISHKIPSIMVALTAGNAENGYLYPLHHPKVIFDENALAIGSCIYAYSAMRWLEEHS